MPRKIQRYGWIPDLPDHRDKLFAAPAETLQSLPPSVDLPEVLTVDDRCPPADGLTPGPPPLGRETGSPESSGRVGDQRT